MRGIKIREILFRLKGELTLKERAYFIIRKLIIGFILAIIVNFVYSYFFHTPKLFSLSRENSELVLKYKLLQSRIDNSMRTLSDIRRRDNGIYRSIFAADTLSITPVYGDYGDSHWEVNSFTPLISATKLSLDQMLSLLYTNSLSLDTLQLLAKGNDKMSRSVPAIWPIDRSLLRGHIGKYGGRYHPVYGGRHFHQGVDLASRKGTDIYATADGRVVSTGYDGGYGISVLVDHGYGYKTRYAHLTKSLVTKGQQLKRGELLGLMGSTGTATGVHLHYEVLYRGRTVDPMTYLAMDISEEEFKKIIESAKETTYE